MQLDSNPELLSLKTNITTIWPNWPNDWAMFWVLICTTQLTVCSCHVTYAFQSESTLYSCLNVKELLARSRCIISSLSDCNLTRTQNHLVRKRTLNHLAKLTKWLSCVLGTYLYGAIDSMFLSCHIRISCQVTIERWFTLKCIQDIIRTYSQFSA